MIWRNFPWSTRHELWQWDKSPRSSLGEVLGPHKQHEKQENSGMHFSILDLVFPNQKPMCTQMDMASRNWVLSLEASGMREWIKKNTPQDTGNKKPNNGAVQLKRLALPLACAHESSRGKSREKARADRQPGSTEHGDDRTERWLEDTGKVSHRYTENWAHF